MTPTTLLADLQALGITLQADGDRLRFHPRDAVTPELLARIREHKADLLRLLATPTTTPTAARVDDQQPGPVPSVTTPAASQDPRDAAGPDLTGWTTYHTPSGRQGIESPNAGRRWNDAKSRAMGRLVGDVFPPRPPADVDPRILATPVVMCPRCGAAGVLAELRATTGGTCWDCHTHDLQPQGPARRKPQPRRTKRNDPHNAPTVLQQDLPEPDRAPRLGMPDMQGHAAGTSPAGRGTGPATAGDTADAPAQAQATTQGKGPMRLERRGSEWWIANCDPYTVDGQTYTAIGPYATKAEAADDLRGLRRTAAGNSDDADDE